MQYFVVYIRPKNTTDTQVFVTVSGDHDVTDIHDTRVAKMDMVSAMNKVADLRLLGVDASYGIYRPAWRDSIR